MGPGSWGRGFGPPSCQARNWALRCRATPNRPAPSASSPTPSITIRAVFDPVTGRPPEADGPGIGVAPPAAADVVLDEELAVRELLAELAELDRLDDAEDARLDEDELELARYDEDELELARDDEDELELARDDEDAAELLDDDAPPPGGVPQPLAVAGAPQRVRASSNTARAARAAVKTLRTLDLSISRIRGWRGAPTFVGALRASAGRSP